MKNLLLAILLTISSLASSQNFLVIDSSEKTMDIFDYDDPRSFVSVLLWNYNYLSYFDKTGIQPTDLEQLTKEQRAELIPYVGPQSADPVVNNDRQSPGYGDYLIEEDPETGDLSFVYPPRDTVFVDLKGITRMVLEYEEGKEPLLGRITRVTLSKKYAREYVPVVQFEGNEILNLNGFQFFTEILPQDVTESKSSAEKSYWRQLEDSSKINSDDYYLDLDFFPMSSLFSLWTGMEVLPQCMLAADPREEPYYALYDDPNRFPFDFWYGESLFDRYDFLEELRADFDSLEYDEYQSDVPLLDYDPDSPNFGEYLTVTDSSGIVYFLYPAPEIDFHWVHFTPSKSYAIASLSLEEKGIDIVTEKRMFTRVDATGEHLVLIHDLEDYWRNLAGKEVLDADGWKAWYNSYLKALGKGKKFDGSEATHRQKMNMSASFWKQYDK